jgi:hypothetical protein
MLNDARRASSLRGIPLQEAIQGLTKPREILETKWNWME